jgi:toxin ParE1/3/4
MFRYRLSEAAQGDVLDILAWTDEQFGEVARLRYESLIVAALRDLAHCVFQPIVDGISG